MLFMYMASKIQAILPIVLAVIVGGGIVFGVMQFQHMQQTSVLGAQQEIATTVNAVGKLMELPTNEMPTIATVSDINKLKSQAFFRNAQNGDKVVIYTQNKEAILYRPSTNKIIKVAPVNIQTTPTAVPTVTATIFPTETPIPTRKPFVPTRQVSPTSSAGNITTTPAIPTANP